MSSLTPGSDASQASLRETIRITLTGIGGPDDSFIQQLADSQFDIWIDALRDADLGTTAQLELIFADVRERLVDNSRKKFRGRVFGVADGTEAIASAIERSELPS